MEIDRSIRIPPLSSRWELFKTDSLCKIQLPRRINNSEKEKKKNGGELPGPTLAEGLRRALHALHASYRSYIIAGQRKEKKRLTASRLKSCLRTKSSSAVGQMRDAEWGAEAFKLRLDNESVALLFISCRVCLCHVSCWGWLRDEWAVVGQPSVRRVPSFSHKPIRTPPPPCFQASSAAKHSHVSLQREPPVKHMAPERVIRPPGCLLLPEPDRLPCSRDDEASSRISCNHCN